MGRQRQSLQHIGDGIFWEGSFLVKNLVDSTIIHHQNLNILSLRLQSLETLIYKQLDAVL